GSAWSLVRLLIRDAVDLKEADPRHAQHAKVQAYLRRRLGEEDAERAAEFLCEIIGLRSKRKQSQLLLAARSNPEVMRQPAGRALHDWLDAEPASPPVLLVVEDLHWGDNPSVAFLADALREKPDRPLMLLAMARPEVERTFPELCQRAELRVRLPGLGSRAVQ